MYVPNARTDECYNEKYLVKEDKDYIKGYDYAVEDTLDTIFDNIGDMDFDVEGEDIDLSKILTNHPNIADKLKEQFKFYFEMERDEMIVSMIDNMADEDYAQIKESVDNAERKN